MRFPTEIRIFVDNQRKNYIDIFDNRDIVVNIKKSNKKGEVKNMLENEKVSNLDQLKSLKGVYAGKLEELEATDINALIESKVAEVRETIAKEVTDEHNAKRSKIELKLETIDEMIADVEAVEVETPIAEVTLDESVAYEQCDNSQDQ